MQNNIKSELVEIRIQAEIIKRYLTELGVIHRLINDGVLNEMPDYANEIMKNTKFHAEWIEDKVDALIGDEDSE